MGDSNAPRQVGLDPQPMVDWFSPQELMRAAVKAVLATTFGNYADKREVQAALFPGPATVSKDYSTETDLWFDYAADMGDGFNPTYAVNWLMAQPSLKVYRSSDPKATDTITLPMTKFVVLGGDQVYPLATREEYRKRMVDPSAMAFRTGRTGVPGPPDNDAPGLFVLPGNHDWYDGLTSFIRLFCQGRTLGPLQTCQQRSYFVIRLPGDWWLWGVDVQLEADLDDPQKKFFNEILDHMTKVSEGRTPRVIVCTGQPSWVHCGTSPSNRDTMRPTPADHNTLSYLERFIAKTGAQVALTLSGDLHHYSHYVAETPGGPHRVTAGGGGAYFYPTHNLPERLDVPTASKDDLWRKKKENEKPSETYIRKHVYPDADVSRGLARGVWRLPRNNKKFTLFLGSLYLLFTWVIQSASKAANSPFDSIAEDAVGALKVAVSASNASLLGVLSVLDVGQIGDAWSACWHVMRHSPATVSIAGLVIFALFGYRAADKAKGYLGAVHGVAHVALSLGLIWFFAVLNLRWLDLSVDGLAHVFLFSFEMLVVGGLAGGLLFAFYLWLSARYTGVHMNDVYSSQAIQDHKNFVRFHVKADGALEFYPIGIPAVPGDDGWRVTSDNGLVPAAGEIRAELIGNAPVSV